MFDQIDSVIWDWNGTLLNDTELCVWTMNELLIKRELPLLSVNSYKEVFSFPVKDYYRKIGFDFQIEPFEIPALQFIESYNKQVNGCKLQADSLKVLNYFKSIGIRQFVLSAMHHDALEDCLSHHEISHFFEHISGLDNHYAASKIENGHHLISEFKLNVSSVIIIGDTIHDFEVASQLGCQCVLIANGHQNRQVLEKTGALVINELIQLLA